MPIQNQFKPTPAIDLPFLNAWRDKIIEQAIMLGINVPEQRELIDFEVLFNEIKDISLNKRQKANDILSQIDKNIDELQSRSHFDIVKKMESLKQLVYQKINLFF